jgi:glutamine---fructose-6-phosphate transaminase (isomerizing)
MLKEIHEQPAILANIAAEDDSQAIATANLIKKSRGTYMVGCGTAAYACMAGSYLFSKIAHRHVNWAIGSEFSYQLDFLTPESLVIALSQSGETMDILEAVKMAKSKGARICSMVNVIGSSLYRASQDKILIGAGPEIAVASTKAFTAKLAHLILIAYAIAGDVKKGQKVLSMAIHSTQKILTDESVDIIKNIASNIKNSEYLFIVGRGLSYPASLESALKIKEISYINAIGLAAGELKHGPLAMVEIGTPCIVFCPDDETREANLSAALEMKARGGHIIGISSQNNEAFDDFIPVSDAHEATIIPNVIVGQLLAYYISTAKELDPDKPRNLAKSVTVK